MMTPDLSNSDGKTHSSHANNSSTVASRISFRIRLFFEGCIVAAIWIALDMMIFEKSFIASYSMALMIPVTMATIAPSIMRRKT